ncbi:MFS transporter [Sporosarcina sp. P13]|uniref:MFS transporter n=1 Tax=Sporosarcina sp. P13 TaxID=2048263 RepID=UPI000C16B3DE|nr:MFS transporter [Sporosarcina sp. P13]PIC64919.1 MFS transporter [Sporosarcina sp. P13]
MEVEKLWTKNFIIISIINLLLTTVIFLLLVTIAPYSVEKLDASTSLAGLISGIFIIGVLMGRLITGRFIQSIGSRKILFIGLFAFIFTTALYFIALNIPLLLITRLVHGFTLGIASTATGTIVAQIIPVARRGEGIGFFSLSSILATAIGPFLGILFLQLFSSYNVIFLLNLVLASSCLLIALMVKTSSVITSHKKDENQKKGVSIRDYLEFKTIPISIVAMLAGFSFSGIMSFISFYTEEIGLVKVGSIFFVIYATVILLSRPFTGRIMDQKGANIIIYPCLTLYAIGMLLFSQAQHGYTILLAAVLIGLGYGNFHSIAQAIAIKKVPVHRLGLATSTYFIFFDLGLGIGPYLIGSLVTITGYRGVYLTMVMVILLSIVLYYFLHGRKEKTLNHALSS